MLVDNQTIGIAFLGLAVALLLVNFFGPIPELARLTMPFRSNRANTMRLEVLKSMMAETAGILGKYGTVVDSALSLGGYSWAVYLEVSPSVTYLVYVKLDKLASSALLTYSLELKGSGSPLAGPNRPVYTASRGIWYYSRKELIAHMREDLKKVENELTSRCTH